MSYIHNITRYFKDYTIVNIIKNIIKKTKLEKKRLIQKLLKDKDIILHIKQKKHIAIKANCTSKGKEVSEKVRTHIHKQKIFQLYFRSKTNKYTTINNTKDKIDAAITKIKCFLIQRKISHNFFLIRLVKNIIKYFFAKFYKLRSFKFEEQKI